jgi:hypothetical protein
MSVLYHTKRLSSTPFISSIDKTLERTVIVNCRGGDAHRPQHAHISQNDSAARKKYSQFGVLNSHLQSIILTSYLTATARFPSAEHIGSPGGNRAVAYFFACGKRNKRRETP